MSSNFIKFEDPAIDGDPTTRRAAVEHVTLKYGTIEYDYRDK
jgi:hypothetical protein